MFSAENPLNRLKACVDNEQSCGEDVNMDKCLTILNPQYENSIEKDNYFEIIKSSHDQFEGKFI